MSLRRLLLCSSLALVAATGCDDKGADGAGGSDGPTGVDGGEDGADETEDADGDGVTADTDCDDADAAVFPGATEVCDGVDNDCDGAVDDDDDSLDASTGVTVWVDADGDGHGASDGALQVCVAPAGTVDAGGDCDDTSAAVSPDASEVCDGIDNDCDGAIDDADDSVDTADGVDWYTDADGDGYGAGAVERSCVMPETGAAVDGDCDDADAARSPASVWYADTDGDGYGDADTATTSCETPSGTVADATDCDDSEATTNPGAPELCDLVDNDCDGATDDADDSLDPALLSRSYTDADGDGYGDDSTAVDSCFPASGTVAVGGDCDDAEAAVNPGATEVCGNGLDDDCDGGPNDCAVWGDVDFVDADIIIDHTDSDSYWGYDLTVADLDGDGAADLISAAYDGEPLSDGTETGQVFINWGPLTGDLTLPADADVVLDGAEGGDNTGVVNRTGDLDGDGHLDLVIGAPDADWGGTGSGGVYLVYGPASAWAAQVDLASGADAIWTGNAGSDRLGTDLATGLDVDGDGIHDLLIGADGDDDGGTSAGAVFLIYGQTSGHTATSALSVGPVADTVFVGEASFDYLGDNRLIADAGDLDGDGIDDIVLGSRYNDTAASSAGRVYVFYGTSSGFSATVAATDADAIFQGVNSSDYLGESVEFVGDLDGDGTDELGMGAPGFDGPGGGNSGGVFVLAGSTTRASGTATAVSAAVATITGDGASDGAGEGIAGSDLDADGFVDLLVGNDGDDDVASGAGEVAVFYGPVSGSFDTNGGAALLAGPGATAYMGRQVRAGDLNDDGYGDVVGIAYGQETVGIYLGGAW